MNYVKKYDILSVKRIFFFLFFLSSFSLLYAANVNKKIAVLKNSKQLVLNESGENSKTRSVIHLLDSLMRVESLPEADFTKAINRVGEIFRQQGKLIPAIELYLNTISYYKQINNPAIEQLESLVVFYIPLGASHEELGMWSRAMDFYYEALNLAEENNFEIQKAMIYNNIGAIHYNRGELEKAEYYLLKAVDINKRLKITGELFNNYNNLAGIYISHHDYNRALDYALLAIQQLNYEEDAYLYYFMQSNIAGIYLMKKDYKLALSYLINAMEHQKKNEFASDLVQTYASLSQAYESTGRQDSARLYMEKSLQQAQLINNKNIEGRIQQEAAAYYERNREPGKAYHALMNAFQINDSIFTADNQQKMNGLEKIYLAEKKNRENELQIRNITLQKLASDRLWIISASIALLLVIVILFMINYSKAKEKERKNEELLLQRQKILYEKENELQKERELELNQTIDQKNRELTSYTLYMIKNNEFIADLKNELKQILLEINPKERQNKEHVRQLLNKLNQQNSMDNWEEFSYYFEKVHPSFYQNLENLYPDLTLKEKRLCAFLRLGLSSKEISSITFKEVRSVESARNRLRKKLEISQEDNLTEFLQNNI
jgi:tetratricopeptide (TPR) repeat protein/DNA-binding CsgD family transcriptional regulator